MEKVDVLVPARIISSPSKAIASSAPMPQIDLMFMQSVFVSTGENKNDDVFLPEEMWSARRTPVYKPVDWEHNTGREATTEEQAQNPRSVVIDNQTIGVMYSTHAVDKYGNLIDESKVEASKQIPTDFHIIDEAVIWKGLYPKVAARIEEGAKANNLFVSMEAWFNDYNYLVGNKIVARNSETAFLDNFLRAYGGNGVYENTRVRRILRGLTFGGKGIVNRPANEPSVITSVTHEPLSTASVDNKVILKHTLGTISTTQTAEELKDMSEVKQTAIATVPLEQFTKAHEEVTLLRSEVKQKDGALVESKAKATELEGQLKNLNAALVKGAQQLDKVLAGFAATVSADNPENFFSQLASYLEKDRQKSAEYQVELSKAVEKIKAMDEAARLSARELKLDVVLAGIADADKRKNRKEKLMASLKSLSDEAFASMLEALNDSVAEVAQAAKPPFMKKKEEDCEEEMDEKMDAKKSKAAKLASILGLESSDANSILEALENKNDNFDDEKVLKSITAAEKAPPAGSDSQGAPDLSKSYSGLVEQMLASHKPRSKAQ